MDDNPAASSPQCAVQPLAPLGETAHGTVHTIRQVRTLIADDCPFGLKVLARILVQEGNFALIGTATDGRQALNQIYARQPELVLMDYRMPVLDGIEATRLAKQIKNPPRVIIVTSDNTPRCAELAKAAGADGLVDKGGDLRGQLRMLFQTLLCNAADTTHCSAPENSVGTNHSTSCGSE